MLYILDPAKPGTICFGRYKEAIAGYRHLLPAHVAEFAADEERFILNHPRSLHDAWLQSVCVRESRATPDIPSAVSIDLALLGQHHDRTIRITYFDVSRYDLRFKASARSHNETFHGDVFTHEIRVTDAGQIVHEIAFRTEVSFSIECSDLKVVDEELNVTNGEPCAHANRPKPAARD